MKALRRAFAARNLGDESAVSAIEFAIVFPIFLLVVLGILVYGIYFGAVHSVQQLAAEAARASVAGITEAERASLAREHVERAVGAYPLLEPGSLQVEAKPSPADPNLFELDLSYDASNLVIFVLSGLVPMPPKQIRRQAVVRRGGY